jgi:DNA-binding CsgD family transcriptional regulator
VAGLSLIGRKHEIEVLDDLVSSVREQGGALVVRGEAGIGKSVLLAATSDRAKKSGMLTLRTVGVQSEAHLPFAGLHQLLRPILAGADKLPPPQRRALLTAFGVTDWAPSESFLIALAALNLLAERAVRTPLLLIVDDAQWLDSPTADVLAFVARRLESEPMMVLIAIRSGYPSPLGDAGLPELQLGALGEAAAAAILDGEASGLAPKVRARLLVEAAGNPLALVELPMALAAGQLRGGASLPTQLPLTARLEAAFAVRASELPDATRTLLLVASIDDAGVLDELFRAATAVRGSAMTAGILRPAVTARLVEVEDNALRFRHPLMRSAILQAASDAERRTAHAALAGVLSAQPDRAVWHRAAATIGPDEEVALELEAAAARAQRRGGNAVAVAALERAASLSAVPSQRARRILRAIWIGFEVGRLDLVARLVPEIEPFDLGMRDQARLTWLQEVYGGSPAGGAARVRYLVEFAERMRESGDIGLALQFLGAASVRCWAGGDQVKETRDIVTAAAEGLPISEDHPELIAILALAAPIEKGTVVIERLSRLAPQKVGDPDLLRLLGTAATAVGAYDLSGPFLAAAVAGLRTQGRLALLAQALVSQAFSAIYTGEWEIAAPAAEEAGRLARETAQPFWSSAAQIAQATVAALRGNPDLADQLAGEAEKVMLPLGIRGHLALGQIARGLAALARGAYVDGYAQLGRIFDPVDPAYHPIVRSWAIGDLVEAALYAGYRDAARAVVAELEVVAETSPASLLHAGLLYARPLLAEDDSAEALFQDALGKNTTRWPFHRARLLLAFGTWLRRQRRIAESRTPLRAARDAFDALGAIPWGERARQELRASGETSQGRTLGAWDRLSPQELQIAQMAAEGLSNREIAQQLYLSHRTVGYHLYRIFPKLGITSRSKLLSVVGGPATTASPRAAPGKSPG